MCTLPLNPSHTPWLFFNPPILAEATEKLTLSSDSNTGENPNASSHDGRSSFHTDYLINMPNRLFILSPGGSAQYLREQN